MTPSALQRYGLQGLRNDMSCNPHPRLFVDAGKVGDKFRRVLAHIRRHGRLHPLPPRHTGHRRVGPRQGGTPLAESCPRGGHGAADGHIAPHRAFFRPAARRIAHRAVGIGRPGSRPVPHPVLSLRRRRHCRTQIFIIVQHFVYLLSMHHILFLHKHYFLYQL